MRKRHSRAAVEAFIVTRIRSFVTPESAEFGDYSRHETIGEDIPMNLHGLMREVAGMRVNSVGSFSSPKFTVADFYGSDEVCNYRTGESGSDYVAVRVESRAAARALVKVFKQGVYVR